MSDLYWPNRGARFDPGDPDVEDELCILCFRNAYDCVCHECDVCGVFGDPNCYMAFNAGGKHHGMIYTENQRRGRIVYDEHIYEEGQAAKAEYEFKFWQKIEKEDKDDDREF